MLDVTTRSKQIISACYSKTNKLKKQQETFEVELKRLKDDPISSEPSKHSDGRVGLLKKRTDKILIEIKRLLDQKTDQLKFENLLKEATKYQIEKNKKQADNLIEVTRYEILKVYQFLNFNLKRIVGIVEGKLPRHVRAASRQNIAVNFVSIKTGIGSITSTVSKPTIIL